MCVCGGGGATHQQKSSVPTGYQLFDNPEGQKFLAQPKPDIQYSDHNRVHSAVSIPGSVRFVPRRWKLYWIDFLPNLSAAIGWGLKTTSSANHMRGLGRIFPTDIGGFDWTVPACVCDLKKKRKREQTGRKLMGKQNIRSTKQFYRLLVYIVGLNFRSCRVKIKEVQLTEHG